MSNSKPKKTLRSYFTSKPSTPSTSTSHDPIPPSTEQEQPPLKIPRFNEYREAPNVDIRVEVPSSDVQVDVPRVDVPIDIPRIDDSLIRDPGLRRSCQQRDTITFSHHYRVDVFNAAIDYQLMELNHRFPECTTELLILGTTLDPRDSFKSFDTNQISNLAEKFYPVDFLEDGYLLRNHLQHYHLGVVESSQFQNLSTLEDLCVMLADTGLREDFCLVDRLICLLLTLPVSTATTERAFSAMKFVKTRLRNKMDEKFLEDCMILCIEIDIALSIDLESVIDEFNSINDRRAQLK